ncbi:MAG: hypothetical protein ED557_11095 [Balneola sp.]|nr:MAG: hypothetical protein ED557_11095 [Balneola sp.]
MTAIKDLIYFDQDKASSLLSQFEGGLTKEFHEGKEVSENKERTNKVDVKVFQREFGGMDSEKFTRMQTKILHHNLLNQLESFLIDNNMLLDLNQATKEAELDDIVIRSLLEGVSYVRAEGYCTINDFERLKKIMSKFSWLVDFINKCNKYSIEQNEDIKLLRLQVEEIKKGLNDIKDRNKKAQQKSLVSSFEKDINEKVKALSEVIASPDEWLLEGFSEWVDTFNKDQIHLRSKPFDNYEGFEVICNLKKSHFVEDDLNHIMFSYGKNPNVKLTVLGLITSKPSLEDAEAAKQREFLDGESNYKKVRSFGNSVLNVFDSMEGIEAFGRFVTYPDITIYPLGVYRNIENQSLKSNL